MYTGSPNFQSSPIARPISSDISAPKSLAFLRSAIVDLRGKDPAKFNQ
jgi:hypothetical protein